MKYSGFGLGCGQMRMQDRAEGAAVIHEAIEMGVTFFNTADFYGSGESELVLGNALQEVSRDQYYISLKFGALTAPNGALYGLDVHPKRIKNYLTHSLKRLQLDYVDLYQPSRIDLGIPVEDTIGAIAELVQEGYVRHIGVTQVDAATLERANAVHPIESVEMEYSLFHRDMEEELLPTARRLGISVVAFGVIAHGLLSGAWTMERIERGDLPPYGRLPLFEKGNVEQNIALVEQVRAIAEAKGVSLSQLAHAWALSKGTDVVPLIGASKLAHFQESIWARELFLSEEEIQSIEAAIPKDQIAGASFHTMSFRNGDVVL